MGVPIEHLKKTLKACKYCIQVAWEQITGNQKPVLDC